MWMVTWLACLALSIGALAGLESIGRNPFPPGSVTPDSNEVRAGGKAFPLRGRGRRWLACKEQFVTNSAEPRFLILETSGRTGAVALAQGARLLGSRRLEEA